MGGAAGGEMGLRLRAKWIRQRTAANLFRPLWQAAYTAATARPHSVACVQPFLRPRASQALRHGPSTP